MQGSDVEDGTLEKARREFDARVGASSRMRTVQRPTVKRLWASGLASENWDEWVDAAMIGTSRR